MSDGSGKVSFVWADGERHDFFLGLEQLRELQAKTGIGPFALMTRIANREFLVDDLRHTIRLGLIGSRHAPDEVARLMKAYVFPAHPLLNDVMPALAILGAALSGPEESPPKKAEAKPDLPVTEGSTSLN